MKGGALPNPSTSQPEVICMPAASHRTKGRSENMFLEHDRCEPPRDCRGVVSTAGWGSFLYKSLPKITEKTSQDVTFIMRYMSITMNRTPRTEVFVVAGKLYLLITNEAESTMPFKPRRMKMSITLVLK